MFGPKDVGQIDILGVTVKTHPFCWPVPVFIHRRVFTVGTHPAMTKDWTVPSPGQWGQAKPFMNDTDREQTMLLSRTLMSG